METFAAVSDDEPSMASKVHSPENYDVEAQVAGDFKKPGGDYFDVA